MKCFYSDFRLLRVLGVPEGGRFFKDGGWGGVGWGGGARPSRGVRPCVTLERERAREGVARWWSDAWLLAHSGGGHSSKGLAHV